MATQSAVRNKRATSDTQTVLRQVDQLQRMSLEQLKRRWADMLGTDPGPHSRDYLIRRLAYRLQELVYGGVAQDARQKLQTRDGTPPGDATSTAHGNRHPVCSRAPACCGLARPAVRSHRTRAQFFVRRQKVSQPQRNRVRSPVPTGAAIASSDLRPPPQKEGKTR